MFKGIGRFFSNLTVSRKLATGFGALVVLTLLVGGVSFAASAYKQNVLDTLLTADKRSQQAQDIEISTLQARRREKDFLLRWKDEGYDKAYANYIALNQQHVQNVIDTATNMQTGSSKDEAALLNQVTSSMKS